MLTVFAPALGSFGKLASSLLCSATLPVLACLRLNDVDGAATSLVSELAPVLLESSLLDAVLFDELHGVVECCASGAEGHVRLTTAVIRMLPSIGVSA